MAYQRRFNPANQMTKTQKCGCGGVAKMRSRKNYPFGTKSKGITSMFFKCTSCQNVKFIEKETQSRR